MNKNSLRNQKWYNNAVAILIGVVGYVVLTHIGPIDEALGTLFGFFKPIIFGCVAAYLVNPLAEFLQRNVFSSIQSESIRWGLSIFVGMIAVILLFMLLLLTLIPQLIESVSLLLRNMDSYIASLQRMFDNLIIGGIDVGDQLGDFMTSSEDLIKTGSQILSTALRRIVSASAGIGKNIVSWLLAVILSVYLLGAKKKLKDGTRRLLKALMPAKRYQQVLHFFRKCNDILVRYIVYSLLDAAIVGGITAVFMAITQMQYIGLIAVVCGVTNLIPSFGPIIGGAIGGFILLLVNPWHALMFIILTCVLQTLDGYVIKPKLFGDSLGVSGLLILISIVVFGNIFGIVGILLAIPMAAIIDFSYEEGILPWLEQRRARLDAEEEARRSGKSSRGKKKEKQVNKEKQLEDE